MRIIKIQRLTWRGDEQLRGRSSYRCERRCHGGGRRHARCFEFPTGIHHIYIIGTHTPALWQFVHIAITGGQFRNGIHRRRILAARRKRLRRSTAFHRRRTETYIRRLWRWYQRRGAAIAVLILIHPLLSNRVPHNLQYKRQQDRLHENRSKRMSFYK